LEGRGLGGHSGSGGGLGQQDPLSPTGLLRAEEGVRPLRPPLPIPEGEEGPCSSPPPRRAGAEPPAPTFNTLSPHLRLLARPHPKAKNGGGGGTQRLPRGVRGLCVPASRMAAVPADREALSPPQPVNAGWGGHGAPEPCLHGGGAQGKASCSPRPRQAAASPFSSFCPHLFDTSFFLIA